MVAPSSPRAMPTLAPVPERQNGPGSELARLVFFSGKFPGSQLPNPECPAGRARPCPVARLEEGSDSDLGLSL